MKEGRKRGIWHISCQSTDKELLPAFVLLYTNCPLHIITFLKLFSGKLKTFSYKAKQYTEIGKKNYTLKITSSWALELKYGI